MGARTETKRIAQPHPVALAPAACRRRGPRSLTVCSSVARCLRVRFCARGYAAPPACRSRQLRGPACPRSAVALESCAGIALFASSLTRLRAATRSCSAWLAPDAVRHTCAGLASPPGISASRAWPRRSCRMVQSCAAACARQLRVLAGVRERAGRGDGCVAALRARIRQVVAHQRHLAGRRSSAVALHRRQSVAMVAVSRRATMHDSQWRARGHVWHDGRVQLATSSRLAGVSAAAPINGPTSTSPSAAPLWSLLPWARMRVRPCRAASPVATWCCCGG